MTHHVTINGATLTKRYTSWSRGEPEREWTALQLLAMHVPGLTPSPLSRDPLSMTLVPGDPLSGSLTSAQLSALGDALDTLWSITPVPLRPIDVPALVERTVRGLTGLRSTSGVIGEAARLWSVPDGVFEVHDPVVAHGDPNLANYLWDGTRVRIVDFEDAGLGDRTFELANLVEHLSGRETDWASVVRRFDPDPDRFHAARCLWAGFWLTLIRSPGTAEAQARRVVRLVGGGV
jgi:aminoglycoside phosphotransferase (APT) family kinase protein